MQENEDTAALSLAIFCQGKCHENQSAWDEAVSTYELARHLDAGTEREMWEAQSLDRLGRVAFNRGDPAQAQDFYMRALEIRERLAPHSLEVAQSLSSLGNVAGVCGDLAQAQDFFIRALEIKERLTPSSLYVATSLLQLGNVAFYRGDLTKAQDFYMRALEIQERASHPVRCMWQTASTS